jgi:hypothetical protein
VLQNSIKASTEASDALHKKWILELRMGNFLAEGGPITLKALRWQHQ